MGAVEYERAYYHCPHCHHGHAPTDEEFGLESQYTPGAQEVIAIAGATDAFVESANIELHRLAGLTLSASTVQRVTEAVGDVVAARLAEGETFGPDEPWEWTRDAAGKSIAYVGLDLISVRQQGPQGERAAGRMPVTGIVFRDNARSTKHSHRGARYVCGLGELEAIGQELRRECLAVGVQFADHVVALTDGGSGLEQCLTVSLAGIAKLLTFVLDFWHASEHLQEFGNVFVREEAARKEQVTAWCHTLKHEGGRVVLEQLEALDLAAATPAIIESHRQLTGYLRHNLHRTDYPTYVANGWQIGSGRVESACNSVVAWRLKGPGMRWREHGTNSLCRVRAVLKSEPTAWQHLWSREDNATPNPRIHLLS